MFRKILVATDGSEYSQRALKTALEVAQKSQAEIELLFVMAPPEAYWNQYVALSFEVPILEIERAGELTLEATLEGIDVGGILIKKKKIQGHAATMIIEEVKKENIDLIVMGSHGYGPLIGSMLGSVSQRVVQQAECPVLIVK